MYKKWNKSIIIIFTLSVMSSSNLFADQSVEEDARFAVCQVDVFSKNFNLKDSHLFYLECLKYREKKYGKSHVKLVTVLSHLMEMSDEKHNLEYSKRILDILKTTKQRTFNEGGTTSRIYPNGYYIRLARHESDSKNYQKAIEYIQLAIDDMIEEMGPTKRKVGELYADKGFYWLNLKKTQLAIDEYNKALSIFLLQKDVDSGPNIEVNNGSIMLAFTLLGDAYSLNNDFSNALDYYKKALDIYPSIRRSLEFEHQAAVINKKIEWANSKTTITKLKPWEL